MPIFDYKCEICSTAEEKIVKNSEVVILCENCGGDMTKQMSAPNFVLKGEGFYGHGSAGDTTKGPKIPEDISRLSDVELNQSLGLPDDHT